MYSPDVYKYSALYRKARVREYQYQQQVYYTNLIKEILISRQVSMLSFTKKRIPNVLDLLKTYNHYILNILDFHALNCSESSLN